MTKPTLARVLLVFDRGFPSSDLTAALSANDFECSSIARDEETLAVLEEQRPDLVLLDMDAFPTIVEGQAFCRKAKAAANSPVIAMLSGDALARFDFAVGVDDFVLKPCQLAEVIARVKRVLWRTSNIDTENLIKHADLVIDLIKYEVTIAGKIVDLSFKEYELLKVLVSNKGRVLTRQALLDKVWGHDYYGGDRTVDVHIRRLRSKIEDADHSFVQTVRNIGYKFKES